MRIRIQQFCLMWTWIQLFDDYKFFFTQKLQYLFLGCHKWRRSYRKGLQPLKREHSAVKTKHSFCFSVIPFYVDLFCPPESWWGSAFTMLSTKTGTDVPWLESNSHYLADLEQLLLGWTETAVNWRGWNSCNLCCGSGSVGFWDSWIRIR
jgi:hypothetical protein